jgi:hypothetical protein
VSLAKHDFADLPSELASMDMLSLRITSNSYNKLKPIVIIPKKDKSKQNNFNVSENKGN